MSKNKQTLPEQHATISKILKSLFIDVNCIYLGFGKTKQGSETWEHDKFLFNFKSAKIDASFEFKTGVGHRFLKVKGSYPLPCFKIDKAHYTKHDLSLFKGNTSIFKNVFVMQPDLATLFYSLVSDAEVLHYNFFDWCDNFGYDQDSRNAEKIYFECLENSKKLEALLGYKNIQTIRELLEDF